MCINVMYASQCPNDAIYMGELTDEIDPQRTECVGHFEEPQCSRCARSVHPCKPRVWWKVERLCCKSLSAAGASCPKLKLFNY